MWLSVWLREIIRLRFVVLSKTTIFLHFWYCLPSPKNRSGHPMEYAVTQTFWPLPAIRYGDSWMSCTIVAIRPALGKILCFDMPQTSSKVNSPHGKSNLSVCFKSLQLVRGQMFQFCFFLIRKLIIINTDTGFGFSFKDESTLTE